MRMGRQKEFDEQVVLERAMNLFWERGYAGLGLAELLERMQISRQSLYDTFGNKRQLFIRTIEHYRATQLAGALALLERDGSPIQNVKDVVSFFEGLASDARCRGCLVANALVGVHRALVALVRRGLADGIPSAELDRLAHLEGHAALDLLARGLSSIAATPSAEEGRR